MLISLKKLSHNVLKEASLPLQIAATDGLVNAVLPLGLPHPPTAITCISAHSPLKSCVYINQAPTRLSLSLFRLLHYYY